MNRITRLTSSVTQIRMAFSQIAKTTSKAPSRREYLQFSKNKLVDFGELPHGQIPDALKSSRPSTIDKLPNGVRIVSEYWIGNEAA
jgi:hypothetical protein